MSIVALSRQGYLMLNIIIPVFHSRRTLPDVLTSLSIQTIKDFFITIVQDGDEEDYSDIIKPFIEKGMTINVMNLPKNVGPGLARQAAMDADNESEFFMLCDSDDLLMPQAVESLYRGISTQNLDIVTSSFIRHQEDKNLMQDVSNTAITWCAGKIYRAKYLKENNIRFHPILRLNEDSYFNVVAWNATEKRGQLREVTVLMMDNPNSLTRKDGIRGFFRDGWEQYILSQADGLKEIYKQTLYMNPAVAARTLVYLYNECMIAVHSKYNTDKAKYYLRKLNTHWLKESMNQLEFWTEIESSCKGIIIYDNEIIFPQIGFSEWLNWIFK